MTYLAVSLDESSPGLVILIAFSSATGNPRASPIVRAVVTTKSFIDGLLQNLLFSPLAVIMSLNFWGKLIDIQTEISPYIYLSEMEHGYVLM